MIRQRLRLTGLDCRIPLASTLDETLESPGGCPGRILKHHP